MLRLHRLVATICPPLLCGVTAHAPAGALQVACHEGNPPELCSQLAGPPGLLCSGTRFGYTMLCTKVHCSCNVRNAALVSQVSYMILQRVSPVTHSIGNCLKRVIVIVASVIFFQNPMGRQNQIGARLTCLRQGTCLSSTECSAALLVGGPQRACRGRGCSAGGIGRPAGKSPDGNGRAQTAPEAGAAACRHRDRAGRRVHLLAGQAAAEEAGRCVRPAPCCGASSCLPPDWQACRLLPAHKERPQDGDRGRAGLPCQPPALTQLHKVGRGAVAYEVLLQGWRQGRIVALCPRPPPGGAAAPSGYT